MSDEDKGWRESLTPETAQDKALDKFDSMDALAQGYVNLEKQHRASKKTPLPEPGWTEEQWALHYEQLGRPMSPADYDLGDFTPPEGFDIEGVLQMAHKRGLNSEQARGIAEGLASVRSQANASRDEAARTKAAVSKQELAEKWGLAEEHNLKAAQAAAQEAWGEGSPGILGLRLEDGTLLSQNAAVLEGLARIGAPLMESRMHGPKGGGEFEHTTSPEAAQKWFELNGARLFQAKKAAAERRADGAQIELIEKSKLMHAARAATRDDPNMTQNFSSTGR